MIRGAAVCAFLFALGCKSNPVAMNAKFDPFSKPAYEDYFDTYALGFIGQATVNVQQACMDQKVYGVQRTFAFDDGVLTFVTLGIYSPMTVRVWCGD